MVEFESLDQSLLFEPGKWTQVRECNGIPQLSLGSQEISKALDSANIERYLHLPVYLFFGGLV